MRFGAALALEWLQDLGAVREVVQGLEDAGIDFVSCASHIVTEAPGRHPEMPDYAYCIPYRDLPVLFTHLAAHTRTIHLRTDLLILPLYPTATIARQSVDLSEITGGRFELGVGISWNEAEYTALGQDLRGRGLRFEEQLQVLRLLWAEPRITFHGDYHQFNDVGLGQIPPAPIPVWIGCSPHARLLDRVARLADGWMPNVDPVPHVTELAGHVNKAGRPQGAVRVAGRLKAIGSPEEWLATAVYQQQGGVTDLAIWPPTGASPTDALVAMLDAHKAIASI